MEKHELMNILYNNAVQTPFSIFKSLVSLHCIPSQINYMGKMRKWGFAERVAFGSPYWMINEEEMNSQPAKKEVIRNHYFSKVLDLGKNWVRGDSKLENAFSVLPQQFIMFSSEVIAAVEYAHMIKSYGTEILIPLAITTGLSLIYEMKFDKKIKNLEDSF